MCRVGRVFNFHWAPHTLVKALLAAPVVSGDRIAERKEQVVGISAPIGSSYPAVAIRRSLIFAPKPSSTIQYSSSAAWNGCHGDSWQTFYPLSLSLVINGALGYPWLCTQATSSTAAVLALLSAKLRFSDDSQPRLQELWDAGNNRNNTMDGIVPKKLWPEERREDSKRQVYCNFHD